MPGPFDPSDLIEEEPIQFRRRHVRRECTADIQKLLVEPIVDDDIVGARPVVNRAKCALDYLANRPLIHDL